CPSLGQKCGVVSDGCGGMLDCGNCAAPATCGGGGVTTACGCMPTSCVAQGFTCGLAPDGCGSTLNCGPTSICKNGTTCGGGGTSPNKCGMGPCMRFNNCSQLGKDCGIVSDGC